MKTKDRRFKKKKPNPLVPAITRLRQILKHNGVNCYKNEGTNVKSHYEIIMDFRKLRNIKPDFLKEREAKEWLAKIWDDNNIPELRHDDIKSPPALKSKYRISNNSKVKEIFLSNKELIYERENSKLSNGENLVYRTLEKIGLRFVREKHFPSLKNPKTKKLLFFDFYLPEINAVIEFDGKHHYTDVGTKERDSIKDKFCFENNIQLLRIPYWDIHKIDSLIREFVETIYV